MPKVKISHVHQLPVEEAKKRLNNILDPLLEEFGKFISDPVLKWEGNTAYFSYRLFGGVVKGTVTVGNLNVEIHLDFPIVVLPLKKIALKITAKRMAALLDQENRYDDVAGI